MHHLQGEQSLKESLLWECSLLLFVLNFLNVNEFIVSEPGTIESDVHSLRYLILDAVNVDSDSIPADSDGEQEI